MGTESEISRFKHHIPLISSEDQLKFKNDGFAGPPKDIPDFGIAQIVSWSPVTSVDEILDVRKNIQITAEYVQRNIDDIYFLGVELDTPEIKEGYNIICEVTLPSGEIFDSEFDIDTDSDTEVIGVYRNFVFGPWKRKTSGKELELAVSSDPHLLSEIGFSFSWVPEDIN